MYRVIRFIFNVIGMIGAIVVMILATAMYSVMAVFACKTWQDYKETMKRYFATLRSKD
jgi:hypothetical protein